jgi:hypothetical protein
MLKSLKRLRLFILDVSLQPDIGNVLGSYLHYRVQHLCSSLFELNPDVSPDKLQLFSDVTTLLSYFDVFIRYQHQLLVESHSFVGIL